MMPEHNPPDQHQTPCADSSTQHHGTENRLPRRKWFIRGLLLIVLLWVVIPRYLFWAAWHERLALLKEIERMGGTYQVRHRTPEIIANWVGYRSYGIAQNQPIGPLDEVYRIDFSQKRERRTETSAFIGRLKVFPHLETLDLSYGPVTDDWMPQISELRSLKELYLRHCRICGRGFGQLAALPHLERISLTYCPSRDRYLPFLARSPSLKVINLSRCSHVTLDGVADLLRRRRGDPVYIHDVDGRFKEPAARADVIEKLRTTPPLRHR
jgi:hypothetical protein